MSRRTAFILFGVAALLLAAGAILEFVVAGPAERIGATIIVAASVVSIGVIIGATFRNTR